LALVSPFFLHSYSWANACAARTLVRSAVVSPMKISLAFHDCACNHDRLGIQAWQAWVISAVIITKRSIWNTMTLPNAQSGIPLPRPLCVSRAVQYNAALVMPFWLKGGCSSLFPHPPTALVVLPPSRQGQVGGISWFFLCGQDRVRDWAFAWPSFLRFFPLVQRRGERSCEVRRFPQ